MSLISRRAQVLHLLSGRPVPFHGDFRNFYFDHLYHLGYVAVHRNEHGRRAFFVSDVDALVKWWNEKFLARLRESDRQLYRVEAPQLAQVREKNWRVIKDESGTRFVGL
ncbi:hypothetical protein SA496_21350 [Pseudomonas sp. JS3066]|uniref:hypothetical protein n=1 Tax=Pseudomonas sp. JS3066 TaxID=3090665 RepID=UPI002E7C1787|nr:hypothetical protein [Pseudomonas sp. JS3066]WVK92248.1 hypothetical protein SA496_21350 [Pseudomonas sp. JS3066]